MNRERSQREAQGATPSLVAVRARIRSSLHREDITAALDDVTESLKAVRLAGAEIALVILLLEEDEAPDTEALRDPAGRLSARCDELIGALAWLEEVLADLPPVWLTGGKTATQAILIDADLKAATDTVPAVLEGLKDLADTITENEEDVTPATLGKVAKIISLDVQNVAEDITRLEEMLKERLRGVTDW